MAYIYDLTDTWNAGGTTFNGIKLNVTDTASAATSKLITLQTTGTEHFSVTKAGVGYFSSNVGIGTSSPSTKLQVSQTGGNFFVGAAFAKVENTSGTSATLFLSDTTDSASIKNIGSALAFIGSSTERMRIDSSGNLLVGTTATTPYFDGKLNVQGRIHSKLSSIADGMYIWSTPTTGDNIFAQFGTEASYAGRGSITYNRAGGVVAYNTTSDYRAKDILGPVTDIGATIDALKVYSGKMKGATIARPMLVAHEAQEVVPYAVTGEKDAINKDGTDKYQQMDHQVLIPLLIAEIQSLRARVAQLEGTA